MDQRYIVIGEDGRYSTLGRIAPTEADIVEAGAAMARAGLRGWVALASGSFHSRAKPRLTVVMPLNDPAHRFMDAAVQAGCVVARGGQVAP